MREKLNESPVAQVALVAVLVVIAAFMFLKSTGGGESEESGAGPTVATVNGATAAGESPGEAVEAAISQLEAGGAAVSSTEMPTSVPAPPPPAAVIAAYEAGRTVVLLIVDERGVDDRRTARAVAAATAVESAEVFVVGVRELPRYAAITVGLDVNRVPALVVMRPIGLSDGVPQATVDYGYQTPQSVTQAIRDASYAGPDATYSPK